MGSPRLYLRVEASLPRHPKVLRLAEAFDLPPDVGPDLVVAFLLRWWGYCAEFGSGGHPADCPQTVRADFARNLYGQSRHTVTPELDQLLRDTRLMDRYGHPWDWQDYTGKLLAARAAEADKKRTVRRQSADSPTSIVQYSTVQHKGEDTLLRNEGELSVPEKLQLPEQPEPEEPVGAWYGRALKRICWPAGCPGGRDQESRDITVLKRQLRKVNRGDVELAVREVRAQADGGELKGWIERGQGFGLMALVMPANGGLDSFERFRHAAMKRMEGRE